MNKTRKRILWLISVLSFLGLFLCYPYLPDKIPTHWNVNWEIDGWAEKKYIFLIGLLPVAMILLLDVLPKIDPKAENYRKHGKAYYTLQFALVILMIVLSWSTVAAALWEEFNVRKILSALMGIVFLVIGNYMPTLKSNFFMGIKNPWTLSNDVVWRKTHKAGGYVFAVSGILMILMTFINNFLFYYFSFTILAVGIIGVNIYSYLLYRKMRR